ncbi:MAG: hypothetical protein HY315_08165 [Acidobacteria bacterium]|nr:hypothetical protein [Acidobacteriota bacterium]
MEGFTPIIELKQRIAAVYALLSDRFREFPKACQTWSQLAEGERFQCQTLRQLAESADLECSEAKLESLAAALASLERQAQPPQLQLKEAYQISLDLSGIQLDVMAHLVEQMEFPQSVEIKNIASAMSTGLLNLYEMMEKPMAALALQRVVSRTRLRLLSLGLMFLEFDIRNYLTGIMGMSRMLSGESGAEETERMVDAMYTHCDAVRKAMDKLEAIRLQLTEMEKE